ncbi:sigma-E factor negative regulatory protein [Comamonas flocculans]|uniref:Anti-anti-sigma factor n=1 Tax=Comamonas flocculans TaxID=2597701 RepID=A0A5B8RRI4_9BURK|nr:sigma-E factor negative regulatory protein [Comamonas flocculans]QEA12180.1 anti-anti-sigma factor [Comamonas flocculans]
MNEQDAMYERLSALADGELAEHECAEVLAYAGTEPGRATWQAYHVIGDAMRGVPVAPMLDASMLQRLRAQLAQETLVHGPHAVAAPVARLAQPQREAANAPLWHWRLAAGFASLTAAVALGWTAYANLGGAQQGAQLAQAQIPAAGAPATVASALVVNEQNIIRDPRLDEIMRQTGRNSGMSVIMREPLFRNASLEAGARP